MDLARCALYRVADWLGRRQGNPRSVARLVSRSLFRRGERAAALFACADRDPVVHSWLGMHLSALDALRTSRSADSQRVQAAVRSLMAVDAFEEAVSWARLTGRPGVAQTRQIASLLMPGPTSQVLPWVQPWPQLTAAVLHHAGDAGAAYAALAGVDDRRVDPWLLTSVLRLMNRGAEADVAIGRAFATLGLRPVSVDPNLPGVLAFSCPAQPARLDELVSIVMPVRNVAAYVSAALRSLLAQDHTAIELIVVDDASDDETASIVGDIARQDARVRLIRSAHQIGAYGARNVGMRAAGGTWLTFHDGDDWSHPQKISLQVAAARQGPGTIGSISDWIRVRDDGRFTARQVWPLQRLNTSSLLVRRQLVWQRLGDFDAVRSGADSEYLGRISLAFGGRAIARVRLPLSFGAARFDSLTTARSTGFATPEGLKHRLGYWESWNRWHASLFGIRGSASLKLAGQCRPFPVTEDMLMSKTSLTPERAKA